MTIEFNGIEELMWCSAKIKKLLKGLVVFRYEHN